MKYKESLSAKIAAIIFSYIMAVVLVLSVAATVVMGFYKFYFSELDLLKEEILTDMAQSEAYYIANSIDAEGVKTKLSYNASLDTQDYFKRYYKNKNVYYKITFADTGEVISNYGNAVPNYIASADAEAIFYDSVLVSEKYGEEIWQTTEEKIADVEVFIARDMKKNDLFSAASTIIDIGYSLRYVMVLIVLGSLAVFVFLLCYLYCAAGHSKGGVIKCNNLDKIPFDLLTAVVATLAFFSICFILELTGDMVSAILSVAIIGSIDYFIALGYTMSFATRVKTRTLISNNIITYILKFIGKHLKRFFNWLRFVFKGCSLLQKTWIVVLAVVSFAFLFTVIIANNLYDIHEVFVIFMLFLTAFAVCVLLYFAVIMQRIKLGGEQIARGDLQHKIDTKYMFGDYKEFAESLNNINEGLQSAVNEKMKSERFRTELITNVSHDIKTPLTSIISYVDLIKKEKIENETANSYIEVLDRQSLRLKKLIEDLVEASKASSGSLAVNVSPCNVGVLLLQAVGEWTERLQKAGLTAITNLPEYEVNIMADGRHLWRVFDNLLSNICKYSLDGTRVYLDVTQKENDVLITFRNISKFQLNVSEEELMERFVRGDTSRNTEGSGLGLSIAKSLTELQGGELYLSIDADLFKVTLKFKKK